MADLQEHIPPIPLELPNVVDARVPLGRSIGYTPLLPSDPSAMTGFREHIPPFPPEFGEDKGEFFKHYDKIQDELDDEMVKRLKENLDGLLVFASIQLSSPSRSISSPPTHLTT
ncbi:hypothetical protein M407DRAFT_21046 [Tulasnella calospora MUT 4182]|uniref:Uncharacterized protein n=1 Tax=Tulasnella calospora MUT 4182 TaxID=1051891 RepID=A0A0C3M7Z2_9AGAM|nr:hypothetical protein M407DRAFT_21046 [Tulasnella calospora MUT 4182]